MPYTTINKSSDHFNIKLYVGNGSDGHSITGVGFKPDWVWTKNRDHAADHYVHDIVRGVEKAIRPNVASGTYDTSINLQSFDTDGFTVGTQDGLNKSGDNIVSWNWLAGGNAGSSNSSGSTSSTVSANTTSGFSIVKYTNPSSGSPFTVGHGLGAAPKMIITKNISASQTWGVWHTSLGFGKYLRLDSTAIDASANLVTATSTTTFSSYYDHHTAGNEIIAYCFAEKTGFSRFGDYTGNGSTDGTFVYTGFKPAFVIVKNTTATANWVMTDNKISFNGKGSNESTVLFPSSSAVENDGYGLQLFSNGFKFAGGDSASATVNASGNIYIYMAFAEVPLVGSNNVPAMAR